MSKTRSSEWFVREVQRQLKDDLLRPVRLDITRDEQKAVIEAETQLKDCRKGIYTHADTIRDQRGLLRAVFIGPKYLEPKPVKVVSVPHKTQPAFATLKAQAEATEKLIDATRGARDQSELSNLRARYAELLRRLGKCAETPATQKAEATIEARLRRQYRSGYYLHMRPQDRFLEHTVCEVWRDVDWLLHKTVAFTPLEVLDFFKANIEEVKWREKPARIGLERIRAGRKLHEAQQKKKALDSQALYADIRKRWTLLEPQVASKEISVRGPDGAYALIKRRIDHAWPISLGYSTIDRARGIKK